jgi:shikimate kinase
MVRHVVLVGLMGSGKTTVGRRLAARLERTFIDADDAIEQVADRTIAEIFADDGEHGFRALEVDVLEDLLEHHEPTIIASGGGAVLSPATRRRLQRPEVTVVWLDGSVPFLASRVQRKAHRPLLGGEAMPLEVLTNMHAERAPLYAEVADVTVEVEPYHRDEESPKKAMAKHIADLVLAHEAALDVAAP